MNTFYMYTRVEESSIWKGELNHYVPKDQLYNILILVSISNELT